MVLLRWRKTEAIVGGNRTCSLRHGKRPERQF